MNNLIIKITAGILAAGLILACGGCGQRKYKVQIAGDYPIVNHLESSYTPGEEVTVQLATVTEHYYVLTVNGVEQAMDSSDLNYTYFTFSMPQEDILIEIRQKGAAPMPTAPEPTESIERIGCGKIIEIAEKKLLISPGLATDKEEFGETVWLICDYADAYNAGQVVTYTYRDVQPPEAPGELYRIIALLVYME
jgi:hypothetical protein